MRLTEIFMAIFALAKRLPTSATLNQVNPIDLMKTLREDLKLKEVQGVKY